MIAPSARSVVVAAAVALTGTAAFGQQLVNLDTDRARYLAAQCGHIRDDAEQTGCYAAKSIEFSRAQTAVAKRQIEAAKQTTAEANQGIASERQLQRCVALSGTKTRERGCS